MLYFDSTNLFINSVNGKHVFIFSFFQERYNLFTFLKKQIIKDLNQTFLSRTIFIPKYYEQNDLLWQEGFFLDFVQKKVLDKWIRRFVLHSTNLFSENFIFDYVVRFYIDLIVWSGTKTFIFEFTNISSLFLATLLPFIFIFLVFNLLYLPALL